jgi:hypothetical protein
MLLKRLEVSFNSPSTSGDIESSGFDQIEELIYVCDLPRDYNPHGGSTQNNRIRNVIFKTRMKNKTTIKFIFGTDEE